MQQVVANFITPKTRLMTVLRAVLAGLIVFMGLARLRIILLLLTSPTSYQERDILQEYLMAKALLSRVSPYLPLDQLAEMFIGKFPFLTHPAPYPPFVAILSLPLSIFSVNQLVIVWFIIELICLAAIAGMLTILWKGKLHWIAAGLIFFLLLGWYSVMVDLLFGQMTIILTTLVLGALLALRKDKKILAGMLIGLSVAIKMFTWPLVIYFALKKDWRALFSSAGTAIALNLVALMTIGFGPFSAYYLQITMQVGAIYHAFLKNYSLWSIGYRLFAGTQPIGGNYISAPPLINLPNIAPLVSAGLAGIFLVLGLIWAIRTKDSDIAYAIMVCVLVAVSPIAWDHYYIMIVISLAILLSYLAQNAFPNGQTVTLLIILLMLFLFNEYIPQVMYLLNGGQGIVQGNGNRISFASSMLEMLPMLELVIITYLLWRRGAARLREPIKGAA